MIVQYLAYSFPLKQKIKSFELQGHLAGLFGRAWDSISSTTLGLELTWKKKSFELDK